MFRDHLLRVASIATIALVLVTEPSASRADEGMWTFDNPPMKKLEKEYGVKPTAKWLDHLRLSAVRFNNGGSGSFVSGMGLVMTNHHVGFDCIQKLSTKETDYVKKGFIASSFEEEKRCPDLELNVLVSMQDVTERLHKALKGAKDEVAARKEEIARIEKECHDETGLRCNVITLYGGGQYMVYRYRKHTDVRLVFAVEQQIAFFGGDHDNFTYPRHDLDVALFRVYEDGKPFEPGHYLKWSKAGAKEGELVFVVGNPGYSGRQLTVAQLMFLRDVQYPLRVDLYTRLLEELEDYTEQGKEQERQAKKLVFGLQNALKAYGGFLEGLEDEDLMAKKVEEEKKLKKSLKKNKKLKKEAEGAWDDIAKAQKVHKKIAAARLVSAFRGSELYEIAERIVRLTAEKEKPNEKRLEEYRESNLESLELQLFSDAPIYRDLEEVVLRVNLEEAARMLGEGHMFVTAALGTKTPAQVAARLAQETTLTDPDKRRELVKGGRKAVEKSDDPLIVLARVLDPITRKLRKRYENKVEGVEEKAGGILAKVLFEVYGKSIPPDATFTLRLAYGTVKGYEAEGTKVPWKTTFYGLYDRYHSFGGKPPYNLPSLWKKKKDAFKMGTPLNFVSTNDIIGGNSGSPVVNKAGEVVGLVFDGNIESLVWRFVYTDEKERCVSVHSSAIKRALYSVYDAKHIGWELGRDGPKDVVKVKKKKKKKKKKKSK
jgi:hypothetical protein